MSAWKIRVDTGGTFTDAWGCGPDGVEKRCKVLSDGRLRLALGKRDAKFRELLGPASEYADGLLEEWSSADGQSVKIHLGGMIEWEGDEDVVELGNGEEAPVVAARLLTGTAPGCELPEMDFRVATTRGTNALLEHKGADVALFITEGFEDLPVIRDQRRERLFELEQPKEEGLAKKVYGISGRLTAEGEELATLDEEQLRESARKALAAGCKVAAVALLHAWKNPAHEQKLGGWLKEEGFEQITLSSQVAPLIGLLPRMDTVLTDAYLAPVMRSFIQRVREPMGGQTVWMMTSAGGLMPTDVYDPKDSLLSGPAGGLTGAAELARAAGFPKVLSFDMGGTSTDVSRIDGPFRYRQEQQIGQARVVAPALEIETVAAGGGSICSWKLGRLEVGPESAGSDPGPACYGRGGPLTLTDVNLLLGLMDPAKAGIPLDRDAALQRFDELVAQMEESGEVVTSRDELLSGIREIALEKMAEAIRSVSIREGVVVEDHAILAFGGAGPQHACAIAERLGISDVLVPADAGLLSAWGLERAVRQEQRVKQVLLPFEKAPVTSIWSELKADAASALDGNLSNVRYIASLRIAGQDSTLDVESSDGSVDKLEREFVRYYRAVFGYAPAEGSELEVSSLRVIVEQGQSQGESETFDKAELVGPALIQDRFSTCVVPDGWQLSKGSRNTFHLSRIDKPEAKAMQSMSPAVRSGLFRSRFEGILSAMGEVLKRTALSTNVKQRLDYSCALLDADGRLVASAPHVPVHLGALGVCVRACAEKLTLLPGDVVITNHPGAGGSHLPDITLIAPLHDDAGDLVGYVANRAHHAELGGMAPGSMPASARCLAEEGVVIEPMILVRNGEVKWGELESLLKESDYPSRRPEDNLADVAAQLAACHMGRAAILEMVTNQGADLVREELVEIIVRSDLLMRERLLGQKLDARVSDVLDDGTAIACHVFVHDGKMVVDFEGTGDTHPGNLNATPAIARSALLYVLRLWIGEDVPLNEGLLGPVELKIPDGILNPDFDGDPAMIPAVVGGNVETSQRITDLLTEAFGLCANGPGTMNNFLFGDENFGYYETIGGGAGAGPGFDGASGRQVNMTNTAITDPEVFEHRYPVRLLRHAIRKDSGGKGHWTGGDGVIREVEFCKPLTVSFLTQRRNSAPRGHGAAKNGKPGAQWRISVSGEKSPIPGIGTFHIHAGERIRIETPGGGGW